MLTTAPPSGAGAMIAGEQAATQAIRAAAAAGDPGALAAAIQAATEGGDDFATGFLEIVSRAAMAGSAALFSNENNRMAETG